MDKADKWVLLFIALAAIWWFGFRTHEAGQEGAPALAPLQTFPQGANAEACRGESAPLGDIPRSYGWNYGGFPWCFTATFTNQAKAYYESKSHAALRTKYAYASFVNDKADDQYLTQTVAKFTEAGTKQGWSLDQQVSFVASFVQSLPYTSDKVTSGRDDYIRYPVQTLVDNGGDCEDTSILLASFLKEMGYGVILLSPPDHLAVGVAIDDALAKTMAHLDYAGRHYAYIETTGDNWGLGQVPPEYAGANMTIFEV